jgi:hypothetical protein
MEGDRQQVARYMDCQRREKGTELRGAGEVMYEFRAPFRRDEWT